MINKADSEKTKQVELKTSSKICQKRGKFSSYIGNLISEIGEQFGDGEHRLPNIKQALNCWEKSGLAEREFAQLLYQARTLTRQHTSALTNPAAKSQPDRSFSSWVTIAGIPSKAEIAKTDKAISASSRNRMPYFFRVLQDLVNRPEGEVSPEKLLAQPPTEGSKKERPALHNSKRAKALPIEGKGPQPVENKVTPGSDIVESLQSKSEIPSELPRLAEKFAISSDAALVGWQRWEASLQDSRLKAIARRALPVERSQVRPDLQPLVFPPERPLSNERKDFLLVFRNAFDARYALPFLGEISHSLEQAEGCKVEVFVTTL